MRASLIFSPKVTISHLPHTRRRSVNKVHLVNLTRSRHKVRKTIFDTLIMLIVASIELLASLVICGYESKAFCDDNMFNTVNVQTKNLIPWQGDTTLLVDRYDVRLLLDDRKSFEHLKTTKKKIKKLSEREKELEAKMNKERYWDMALHEEEMYKGRHSKRETICAA